MNEDIARGLKAYEQKDFETAVPLLTRAIPRLEDPAERVRLRIRLASAHDELGQYTEALAELKAVLEDDPSSAPAWNNIGVICGRLDRLDEARLAFEKAYKLDPENAEHLISLGSVSLKLSDPGNALKYLQLAIELVPGHPVAHANLALTYAVFGRLEEAEDALRLAILYGFEQAGAIQAKINALKDVRKKLHQEAEKSGQDEDGGKEEQPPASGGEAELLLRLEREMFALAEQRYGVTPKAEKETGAADIESRMRTLRQSIRALRRTLGMEEVTDSDVVAGVNYMRGEDETG